MIVANVAIVHRERAALVMATKGYSPVYDNRGSWWPFVREPFMGAWQRNIAWSVDTVLAHNAVYACVTLIASDIGKLRPKLVEQDEDGIWSETDSSAFSPVLRKPNHYQNRIQFIEWWMHSKLIRGNTFALKERDNRGVVRALYLLDPSRVKPLVAPDGSVFYDLSQDNLSSVEGNIQVPASEIIHDRMNCIFHPLIGTSPIFACGLAAQMGLNIENSAASFHENDATPAGILTAPGVIDEPTAEKLTARWRALYGGDNRGKIAALGNGLKFEQLRMSAVDAQIIEHLKWTDEAVCRAFHVPAFKVGAGAMPTYSNGEILDQRYYSDCLQSHIEQFELCMDEGLGLNEDADGRARQGRQLGVELDLKGLLRMDTATQFQTLSVGIGAGFIAPNEARKEIDLKPVPGGDSPMIQQQNFSLEALAERDKDKPFSKPLAPATAPLALPAGKEPAQDQEKSLHVQKARFVFRTGLYTTKAAA